jgi:hypothetical protein
MKGRILLQGSSHSQYRLGETCANPYSLAWCEKKEEVPVKSILLSEGG